MWCAAHRFEIAARRGRLRSRSRGTSVTDAAYPLRVRALRIVYRSCSVGRDHWARRVQELPNSYKFVRFLRQPLRGRHAESSCPTNRLSQLLRRARPLGAPRAGTTKSVQIRLSVLSAAAGRHAESTCPTNRLSQLLRRARPLGVPRAGTTECVQICSSVPSTASRTARRGRRALRIVYRSCSVGRDHWARRVQELPNSYKFVRFLRQPLRGRHAESSCPTNRLSQLLRRARPLGAPRAGTTKSVQTGSSVPSAAARSVEACLHPTAVHRRFSVGRGHAPAACRNYQIRTNPFVCTVRRCAVGGGMPPPYSRLS